MILIIFFIPFIDSSVSSNTWLSLETLYCDQSILIFLILFNATFVFSELSENIASLMILIKKPKEILSKIS